MVLTNGDSLYYIVYGMIIYSLGEIVVFTEIKIFSNKIIPKNMKALGFSILDISRLETCSWWINW